MKCLVTGGAGFIGSWLIKHLVLKGFKVLNLDALTYASNPNNLKDIKRSKNYQFVENDLSDKELLVSILKSFEPNVIFHLAAETHVDNSILDPSPFVTTNVIGTYNLLESTLIYLEKVDKRQSLFKFVHVSTDEVFGDLDPSDQPFSESHPYCPSSPYSASKASSDHFVRAYRRTFDFPAVVTHCSNNFGPHQFSEKLIPKIILNALRGQKIPIYGTGTQIRDWLFVEDHVRALLKIGLDMEEFEDYCIGGGNEKTNIEVAQAICSILDELEKPSTGIKSFSDLISFTDDRKGHDLRYAIDFSKIVKRLSWSPKETFKSGLIRTINWYRLNDFNRGAS